MYSFVINMAILVNKAVEDEITMAAPGLINAIDELPTALPDPTSISVIIKSIFFYLNFYIFSYNIHYQPSEISKYSRDHIFLVCIELLLIDHPSFLFLIILVHFSKQDKYSFINQKNVFLTNP